MYNANKKKSDAQGGSLPKEGSWIKGSAGVGHLKCLPLCRLSCAHWARLVDVVSSLTD